MDVITHFPNLDGGLPTLLKLCCVWVFCMPTLRWRNNGHDDVSNHQPHECLLNRLFRRRSKKISKLSVTGLCAGNSPHKWPVTGKMSPFDDVIMSTSSTHTPGKCKVIFIYHTAAWCIRLCALSNHHFTVAPSSVPRDHSNTVTERYRIILIDAVCITGINHARLYHKTALLPQHAGLR